MHYLFFLLFVTIILIIIIYQAPDSTNKKQSLTSYKKPMIQINVTQTESTSMKNDMSLIVVNLSSLSV